MSSTSSAADSSDGEISALIETMSAAEQRLELLTGGQIDAVLTRDGRTFMLQRSQALIRQHDALRQAAILDALPACVALIDAHGRVASVNQAWRQFEGDVAPLAPTCSVGSNYLALCDAAQGDDAGIARAAATGMRAVMEGRLPHYSVEYACHQAGAQRWLLMMVSPLRGSKRSGVLVTHFDITERTRAQRDLQRSSELLNAVITGTPDAVFVKDRDGRYLLCNEAMGRLLGRDVDDVVGKTTAELHLVDSAISTPDDVAARNEIDRQVMASGQPMSTEDVFGGALGPRTYHATKAPYRNGHGEILGVIGISRDISDRKFAERTLRESQALLSMASRLALVGSWYFDVPLTNVFWSDGLALMHDEKAGFTPTLAQALAYYVPEHRVSIGAAVEACMRDGVAFDMECQIVTAAGRRIWVRAIGEADRGADGRIRRVQGALQDVSERRRAEHKTRLLAERLTNILGSITDAFLTVDHEWRFTFVNSEALRMLGRPFDDLIGTNIWVELPELAGTEFHRGLSAAMNAGTGSKFEIFLASRKGWIGVNCYPSQTGLSIYFSDITQRREDQEALRALNSDLEARVASRTAELTQAREDAEQANRAKSAFLAAMSHEIRTPMNGVVGMIDVLEQSNLKGQQARIVQTVRESAYALLGIVDDVLDFSKIEAGRFQIDHEPMSLADTVEQVCDVLDALAASKGVRLRRVVDPLLPPQVLGDALRLRQILLNLVGNAIKFSRVEGGTGTVDIRAGLIDKAEGRCSVEFVIEDDGIGMDESTLARLFTPFMQGDDSTTKRFGGTGLGLSISQRLAALMGGTIGVASHPGQGSRFTVVIGFEWLDVAASTRGDVDDAADSQLDAMPCGESTTMPTPLSPAVARESGRLILVAEDSEINRSVIRQQLALMGFTAEIAGNGASALDLWRDGSYSMLLTDLHMPGLDGYELTRRIRGQESQDARMPIVALTANASKGEVKRCAEAGIDACMTKPVRLLDLYAMLKKWMPKDAQPLPLRTVRDARRPSSSSPAPLDPFDAVDLTVLRSFVGSDPEVVRTMLISFRKSAAVCRESIREAIRDSVGSRSCKAVSDALHAFKSAARAVGAPRLAAICEGMEGSADAARVADLPAQLVRFEEEYDAVHRFLDEMMQ